MRLKQTLLVTGLAGAMMLSATLATAADHMLTITDLSGTVGIQQNLPCGQTLNTTATIQQGRMDLAYSAVRDQVLFDLNRLEMFLVPFSFEAECLGVRASVEFREFGLRLAGAVQFPGEEVGALRSAIYRFRIPKEKFLIYESIIDNLDNPQPETTYLLPSEDVTGVIDLGRKTVQLHVVLTTEFQFRAGCDRNRCLIDETLKGTTTSDILAVKTPGPTPPTVTCTPARPPAGSFEVAADDESGTPVIKLGTFTLANHEVIQLQQTGQPGVRLVEANRGGGTRLFQVGRGEAFITATDTEGNVGIAYCR